MALVHHGLDVMTHLQSHSLFLTSTNYAYMSKRHCVGIVHGTSLEGLTSAPDSFCQRVVVGYNELGMGTSGHSLAELFNIKIAIKG